MKRYAPAAILWILSMFLLSACGSRGEEEELQRVTLEDVEVLEIDHGSTTLFVMFRCSEAAVPQEPLSIKQIIGFPFT
ncbi:hypothetical protein [Paenibacillus lautus]|uniref:hypothetical protein n=1 Tax=Paenibacillus lautus TaxID=1401 RepID=UPI001ABF0ECE|nr:hypothetical protein [Paenibacillus lautus]